MMQVTERGSVRNPMSTRSAPAGNHVNRLTVLVRASSGRDSIAMNITTDQANARASIEVASQPAFGSPMRLPSSRRTAAPSSGSAGTIHTRSSRSRALTEAPRVGTRSAPQQVDVVGGRAAPAPPEDGHDDGEPDRDLGGGDHEHEEDDRLTADVVERLGERDEREVGGVEHE